MEIADFKDFSNRLMYDIYNLTKEEIQFIENSEERSNLT